MMLWLFVLLLACLHISLFSTIITTMMTQFNDMNTIITNIVTDDLGLFVRVAL